MPTVEARVDSLESILGQFIVHSDVSLRRLEHEMSAFKDEMSAFKDEMRGFKEEMALFKDEMGVFKDEMGVFKDEMSSFRDETRQDRREMNKQWAYLAKKMGTLEEDLIAPAVRPVISKYFNCEPSALSVRNLRRKGGEDFEVDLVVSCADNVFMIEVKSSPKSEHVREIIEKAARFTEFYPEYAGKTVIPMFGGILFPENVLKAASRKGVYAVAYREWDYVDILNFDAVAGRKGR
ncbi:MAG: hypothetical protein HZA20_10435 [Nitrospirae bacterium]|nr:hypothetical protein [Nitrospirota bacterium]